MTPIGPPYVLDPHRVKLVRALRSQDVNGLEFVEVESAGERPELLLYFVKPVSDELRARLSPRSIRVEPTDLRERLHVLEVRADPGAPAQVAVTLDRPGNLHTFTVRLVEPGTDRPLQGIDPWLSAADFSFVTDGPVQVDVVPLPESEPPPAAYEPDAHYLTRDYETFLQLMYDRLALTLPAWNQRHAPDLMVTLVELLAYVADYLSYYQDAVATEAYLATARHRISVRRHARLVDYRMHEGCNARAWVCLRTAADVTIRRKLGVVAGLDADAPLLPSGRMLEGNTSLVFFESMGSQPIELRLDRNQFEFYTGGVQSLLPAGSTSAILVSHGAASSLVPGCLIMLEWNGGSSHAVRLIRVTTLSETPPEWANDATAPRRLVQVEWSASDALPSDVPLAAATVCGNVILVDQGNTVCETLQLTPAGHAPVPAFARAGAWLRLAARGMVFSAPYPDPDASARFQARLLQGLKASAAEDQSTARRSDFGRRHRDWRRAMTARARRGHLFSPAVRHSLRTTYNDPANTAIHAALEHPLGSASSAVKFAAADALPTLRLRETNSGHEWEPRFDLLSSGPDDRHFVVEIDDDGVAWVQFGDGNLGMAPEPGEAFIATYRVGGGTVNVGARQMTALVPDPLDARAAVSIERLWNPAPAFGQTVPETVASVKRLAPGAFRQRRERAVIPADYAELARQITGVADASASVEYRSGADHIRVAILPGPMVLTPGKRADLIEEVADRLARYRRIGHELTVVQARRAPVAVALNLSVQPGRRAAEIERDVIRSLGSTRVGGGVGFFDPARLKLGQAIAASALIAAVQAVPGVRAATLVQFRRLAESPGAAVPSTLTFGPDEVPQLENDPRHPARGHIAIAQDPGPGGRR